MFRNSHVSRYKLNQMLVNWPPLLLLLGPSLQTLIEQDESRSLDGHPRETQSGARINSAHLPRELSFATIKISLSHYYFGQRVGESLGSTREPDWLH